MATETTSSEFGQVSRAKGVVFEYTSLAASLVGILALGVLLVYVSVDAFDLPAADDGWILTYVSTVVVPLLALWLYSAGNRDLTLHVGAALVGGGVCAFVLERGLAALGTPIPRLTWPLVFLFAVVVPLTGYVLYVGSREPIGAAATGVIGRVVGGVGLGAAAMLVFAVFEPQLWLLIYTLAVLPALGLHALAESRSNDRLSLLPAPVGLLGYVVAVVIHEFAVVLVPAWIQLFWALAIPVAAFVAYLIDQRRDRRAATVAGGLTLGVAAAAVVTGWVAGVAPYRTLVVALAAVVPTALYVDRVVARERGRLGLLAPVVIVGGIVLGTVVVGALGFAAPDPWLDWSFLTSAHSRTAAEAGLYPAIVGSVLMISLVAILSFVLGVGTAVFLEDYTPDEGPLASVTRAIQVNIANLAAVPSVVYGLLGLGLFANLLGLGFGTVVTAAVTITLLILPITIISAQEAVRSVPDSLRQASYSMGATRWQTTKNVVIPEAMPGILTGTILALGRAIGETAPLIMIGAATTVFSPPETLFSRISAMPMQIYAWYSFPQEAFQHGVLAAGVVTLLGVLIAMNATAIVLRNRYQRTDAS